MDKKYLSFKNIILLIAVITILVSYQITVYSYEVEVRRAFLDEQDNIIENSRYCSIDSSLMSRLGLEIGQQVKVGIGDKSALYTIVQARDEDGDVVRMGLSGRRRVGQSDPFSGYLTKVEEVKVEKALFSLDLHEIVDNSHYAAIDSNLMESLDLAIGQEIIVRAKDKEDESAAYTIVEALDESKNIIRLGLSGRRRLDQSDPFVAYISSSNQNYHIDSAYNPELTKSLAQRIEGRDDILSLGAVVVSSEGVKQIGATGLREAGADERINHNDPWHLGSLTKAMTATLAGRYVEQGLISFDSTISEILGENIAGIHSGYEGVTLRHLLSNHGGIASNVPRMSHDSNKTVRENRHIWVKETLEQPPANEIGEYNYSNAGFIIAGKMLEVVADDSWENLMRAELFEPLGMNNSGFGPPGSRDKVDAPAGHNYSDGEFIPRHSDNPVALGPAGRAYTSLRDYGEFLAEQLRGANSQSDFLTDQTWEEIFTHHGSGYLLGWGATLHGTRATELHHGGSNTMWYALAYASLDNDIGILVTTNSGNSEAISVLVETRDALIRQFRD